MLLTSGQLRPCRRTQPAAQALSPPYTREHAAPAPTTGAPARRDHARRTVTTIGASSVTVKQRLHHAGRPADRHQGCSPIRSQGGGTRPRPLSPDRSAPRATTIRHQPQPPHPGGQQGIREARNEIPQTDGKRHSPAFGAAARTYTPLPGEPWEQAVLTRLRCGEWFVDRKKGRPRPHGVLGKTHAEHV